MDTEKQAIIDALGVFMRRRSGMEPGNYGSYTDYRQEQRSVTRDLHQARLLLREVELRDGITATDLKAAFRAYSGRLTCNDISARYDDGSIYWRFSLGYCTGQYFPTEYRKAVCAVLAQALWDWKRDQCMPPAVITDGENTYRYSPSDKNTVSAGDWLRASFKRDYGHAIASRWFD